MKFYKSRDWLYQKYWIEKLSAHKIAKICNCTKENILYWMKKFNINRRTLSESKTGKLHNLYGKHRSEKVRIKISKAKEKEKNPQWKGGIIKHSAGYIYILKPDHPFANCQGYVKRSRLVMEQILGRYLLPKEVVHHKNEIRDDDKPENLGLFESIGCHTNYHKIMEVSND